MAEQETMELFVDDSYKNVKIVIDDTIIATQEIIDSISITYGCTDGTAPGFGATFSPHCDVTINSNSIIGDSNIELIQLGKRFYVFCQYSNESPTFTCMGQFYIEQPPLFTDDYQVTFTGEGLLGSVFAKTNIDYERLQSVVSDPTLYEKGIISVDDAIQIARLQFETAIEIDNPNNLTSGVVDDAKIVIPMRRKFRKKNYNPQTPYKKRFVKISGREWIAGIAVMLGCNVVEYGATILFVRLGNIPTLKWFTSDSFVADYQLDKMTYAPKSMYLKTYETVVIKTEDSGTFTTRGFFYESECECNSVYNPSVASIVDNAYDINVECQWIGRSFESYYFSGDVEGNSGDYDDDTPLHYYPDYFFSYTPYTMDFSGWNDVFRPGNIIYATITQKNTETQQETNYSLAAFIMDMVWNWHGTIDVQLSASYNGELSYKSTPTVSTNSTRNFRSINRSGSVMANKDITIRIDSDKAISNAYSDGIVDESAIDGNTESSGSFDMMLFKDEHLINTDW